MRFAIGAVLLAVPAARADRIFPPSTPVQKIVAAEVIVVGTVGEAGADLVPAGGASYRVYEVKVKEALVGAVGKTHVRVGVIPPAPADGPRPGRVPLPRADIKEGQELLLFLRKPAAGDFYVPLDWSVPADAATDAGRRNRRGPHQFGGVPQAARSPQGEGVEGPGARGSGLAVAYRTIAPGGRRSSSTRRPTRAS